MVLQIFIYVSLGRCPLSIRLNSERQFLETNIFVRRQCLICNVSSIEVRFRNASMFDLILIISDRTVENIGMSGRREKHKFC